MSNPTKIDPAPLSLLADMGMRLYLANAALHGILETADPTEDGSARLGAPILDGEEVTEIKLGMVLCDITWTGDRGYWMWDGALVVLAALAIDPRKPL